MGMSVWTKEEIFWGLSVCHQAFQWKNTDKLSLESCKAIDEERPQGGKPQKVPLTFDPNIPTGIALGGILNKINVSSLLNVVT